MALTRRTKKLTQKLVTKITGKKYLFCKECNQNELEVGGDIGSVTCAYCVQKMIAPPPGVQKKSDGEKFPRGWHFKARYVHTDGRVYVRGKLTDETDTPSTVAKKKPKKTVKKTAVKKKPKKNV
jgi:hypothetical protein